MDSEQQERTVMQMALKERERIFAYLIGLTKNPTLAEDLFQETYLVICKKWQQYKLGTNFVAWALTIARYEYLNWVGGKESRLVCMEADVLENMLVPDDSDCDAYDFAAERAALRSCMRKVKNKSREILQLRYHDGLPGTAVAKKLGLSSTALYTILSRTRKALRKCIAREVAAQGGK